MQFLFLRYQLKLGPHSKGKVLMKLLGGSLRTGQRPYPSHNLPIPPAASLAPRPHRLYRNERASACLSIPKLAYARVHA